MELNIDKSQWVKVQFGDVVQKVSNKVDPDTYHSEIVIQGGHINKRDFHIREFENKDELGYLGPAFHMGFKKHQILYVSRNPHLMKVGYPHFDGICANTTFIMETKDESVLRNDLIPFIMHSDTFIEQSVANVRGGVNPYVNWSDLACIEFLLPPKDQQAQLAKLLWGMDSILEFDYKLLHKTNELLKSFVKSIETNESYSYITLDKLLDKIIAGKSLNGANIPIKENEKGVLKISSVGADGFASEENKRLNNQSEFLEKFSVRKGDVLITRANTTELVGRVCKVPDDYPNLMLCDKTLRLDFNEKINTTYVSQILLSPSLRRQIESYATGTGGAMKNITQNEIKSLKIPFPKKAEQEFIGNKISVILNNKKSIETKYHNSKSLQKSLINQVF